MSGPRQLPRSNAPMAVVVVAIAAVVGVLAFSVAGKIPGDSKAATTTSTTIASHTTIPSTDRAHYKVQVANGTTMAGAASGVTQTLQTLGWTALPPVNTTNPVATSAVYFAQGKRQAAVEIANTLKLGEANVFPFTTSVPVPGANGDDVVVIVGPDLAR